MDSYRIRQEQDQFDKFNISSSRILLDVLEMDSYRVKQDIFLRCKSSSSADY